MLDQYGKGSGYQPFVTTDLASGQYKPTGDFKFPFRTRRGAVAAITGYRDESPQGCLRQSAEKSPRSAVRVKQGGALIS